MAKKPKKPKVITKKQFDSWSPDKQQRALNDRRTRIRIADNALPADWLERRKKARWNRTPITEGTSTTYGDLEKQRAYLEPLTFGEGDRQLADRQANLAAARQRDADWFTQYRQQVADAQQRAIGAQTQMAEGNRALIDSANAVSVAGRDAVVKQLQDRAAQLGQVSQAGEYQGIADQAAAARAASLANTAQRQVSDANTRVGLATDAVGTANLKDLEARGFRDRQSSALDKDRADYGSKKDQWRAKFIDDAIAEARKQVLEDRAFGLNAADKAADNKRADKSLSIQEKRLREQRRAARERERLARERESRQAADGGSSTNGSRSDKRSSDRTRRNKRTEAFNSALSDLSGVNVARVIKRSQEGARRGQAINGGADSLIRTVMGQSKVSREVAKRIVYAVIAYNGRVPSSVTWKNAPKTWDQAIALYRKNKGR